MQLKTKLTGIVASCAVIGAIGCAPEKTIDYDAQYEEDARLKGVLFSAADTNQDRQISAEEARAIALRCGYEGYFSKGVETLLDFEYSEYAAGRVVVRSPYAGYPYEEVEFGSKTVKECFKQ